jgi:hypothetical protein
VESDLRVKVQQSVRGVVRTMVVIGRGLDPKEVASSLCHKLQWFYSLSLT